MELGFLVQSGSGLFTNPWVLAIAGMIAVCLLVVIIIDAHRHKKKRDRRRDHPHHWK